MPSRKRIAVAVVLVALVALYAVDPSSAWWVPKCPFKLLTGWSCPACGIAVMDRNQSIEDSVLMAREALLSGRALDTFRRFAELNNSEK